MKIYLLKTSLLESIIADTYSVCVLLSGAWINKFWLGDSYFFNAIFALILISWMTSYVRNKAIKFYSEQDLINHLQEAKAND
jgi:hypothetical protein